VRRHAAVTNRRAADVRPEGGAQCVSSARRDLQGARSNPRPRDRRDFANDVG
jgi:hypothetical protein